MCRSPVDDEWRCSCLRPARVPQREYPKARPVDLADATSIPICAAASFHHVSMRLPPPEDDAMKAYVTVGLSVLAGAALFEAALIPGILIGGAVVLAPKYVQRGLRPLFGPTVRRRNAPKSPRATRQDLAALPGAPARFGIKQAIAKTITFRIIVTTLDFTTNYIVIGELATAAGLSTFNLVVGPVFYLAHETAWNYFGPAGADVRVPVGTAPSADGEGFTVSRALAKTITFRTLATVMDFTVNYVAVGDVATAVGLSAFAFAVGPFVYLGHEKLWDYYGSPSERTLDPPGRQT